jgi:hypothetical protein
VADALCYYRREMTPWEKALSRPPYPCLPPLSATTPLRILPAESTPPATLPTDAATRLTDNITGTSPLLRGQTQAPWAVALMPWWESSSIAAKSLMTTVIVISILAENVASMYVEVFHEVGLY